MRTHRKEAMRIYFDNNSSTPVALSVIKPKLINRLQLETAVQQIANSIGAESPEEIVFTNSGSASNLFAICTFAKLSPGKKHIITTSIEHKSVQQILAKLRSYGYQISILKLQTNGELDFTELRKALRKDTLLVCAIAANGDIGIILPIAQMAKIVKEHSDAFFYSDGAMATGKTKLSLKDTSIDAFGFSAHKIHAPKGIGALYVKKSLLPFFKRNKAFPPSKIFAFGEAVRLAVDATNIEKMRTLRDKLQEKISQLIPSAKILFAEAPTRLPNTLLVSFPNMNGELILSKLSESGIIASTFCVCNTKNHTLSSTISIMNVPYSEIIGTLRFSLSRYNTEEEVDFVAKRLAEAIFKLKPISDF